VLYGPVEVVVLVHALEEHVNIAVEQTRLHKVLGLGRKRLRHFRSSLPLFIVILNCGLLLLLLLFVL
jgi:hypothetical protein